MSIAGTHTYSMTTDHADPSSSSEGEDVDVSDAEPQDDADESASTVESKREDEEVDDEPDVESSSEGDDVGSDDGDFEVDDDVQEEEVEEQSSDAESEKASPRRPSKEKAAKEYYENPDLYGLRRSVSPLPSTLSSSITGLIVMLQERARNTRTLVCDVVLADLRTEGLTITRLTVAGTPKMTTKTKVTTATATATTTTTTLTTTTTTTTIRSQRAVDRRRSETRPLQDPPNVSRCPPC